MNEAKRIKKKTHHLISLWLDSYDDIFSDFDPRLFSERNISDDFLDEIKKVSMENDLSVNEIKLLLPAKQRQEATELIIIKRLRTFFNDNYHYHLRKKKDERKRGLLFIFIGVVMMVLASVISSYRSSNFLMNTLLMVLEPSGWFLVWSGMDFLIQTSKKEKIELCFYEKISKSKIIFGNILERPI